MLQASLLHPEWVLGFIDAEGCFHVAVQRNNTMRLGVQVQLQFCITQHIQDMELMTRFIPFFFFPRSPPLRGGESSWGKPGWDR